MKNGRMRVVESTCDGAHVTAVCSTKNVDFMKSLGSDIVIDYTTDDQIGPGVEFNFILDSVGKFKISKLKDPVGNL